MVKKKLKMRQNAINTSKWRMKYYKKLCILFLLAGNKQKKWRSSFVENYENH